MKIEKYETRNMASCFIFWQFICLSVSGRWIDRIDLEIPTKFMLAEFSARDLLFIAEMEPLLELSRQYVYVALDILR